MCSSDLTATERRDKYNAQAFEYCEVREFPGATRGARQTKEKAIRFICLADAADALNSEGYWMKLSPLSGTASATIRSRINVMMSCHSFRDRRLRRRVVSP